MKRTKPQTKPLAAILLLSMALAMLITPAAMAQDIYVNTSGWWHQNETFNASATPIQHAIDNATAGETICVKDGAYSGNTKNVNKRLTIHSENGSANCVVQVSTFSNVFDVTTSHVNISGITVTSGNHGIHVANADYCNISFNNVTGNLYGVYLTYSNGSTVIRNTASANTCQGIHLNHSRDSLVANNTVSGSTEGIYLSTEMYNSTIRDNNASNNVYGIFLTYTTNNTITNNTASANAVQGIHLNHSTDNLLADNRMSGNPLLYKQQHDNEQHRKL